MQQHKQAHIKIKNKVLCTRSQNNNKDTHNLYIVAGARGAQGITVLRIQQHAFLVEISIRNYCKEIQIKCNKILFIYANFFLDFISLKYFQNNIFISN